MHGKLDNVYSKHRKCMQSYYKFTYLSNDLCASMSVFVVRGDTEGLRRFFNLVADILTWLHSLWKISKSEILWKEMTAVQNLRQYSRENRHRCTITDYHMVRWGGRPWHQNGLKTHSKTITITCMWCRPRPFLTGQFTCQNTNDRGSQQIQHLSQVWRYIRSCVKNEALAQLWQPSL